MAVSIGNTSNDGKDSGNTNHSWSHDNDGNFLVVAFGIKHDGGNRYASSVTYNSVAMTRAKRTTIEQGGSANIWHAAEIWYLANPASGSNTVAVNYSSSQDQWAGGAASFSGVNLNDILEDTDDELTDSGVTSKTITLVATKDNTLFVDMHEIDYSPVTDPSNPTRTQKIYEINDGNSWLMTCITDVATGSDDYVSGSTAASRYHAYCGALFNPAPFKPKVILME